jgi:hypothetical protein
MIHHDKNSFDQLSIIATIAAAASTLCIARLSISYKNEQYRNTGQLSGTRSKREANEQYSWKKFIDQRDNRGVF